MATSTEPMQIDNDTSMDHATSTAKTFHIGTRESMLARIQTDEVVKALRQAWPDHHFEIHAMKTAGDRDKQTALHKFNEKALWTQDLEVQLQDGRLDFIVHSLKDMPTQLPHDLELGCVTKRLDPRDALLIKPTLREQYHSLSDLPADSVIGTSSLRRQAQMKRYYPHLKFTECRGNLGTRLAKLDNPESEYSAIVVAVCGLVRMGHQTRITSHLSKSNGGMLYCVGQGGLGIESRRGDNRVQELLARIACRRTTLEALAERSLMRTLEGGCSVPIGVEMEWVPRQSFLAEGSGIGVKPADDYDPLTGQAKSGAEKEELTTVNGDSEDAESDEVIMRAIVVSLDGTEAAEVETRRILRNNEDAEQFGWDVARMLVEKGADKILEKINLNRTIIKDQGDA